MKLLFVFCAESNVEHVRRLIDVHEVHGAIELPEMPGSAEGRPPKSERAWPGASAIIITAVPEPKASELIDALTSLSQMCAPDEGLRVFQIPAERLV